MATDELIVVYETSSTIEAAQCQARLREAGVFSVLSNVPSWGMLNLTDRPIRLLVNPQVAEHAQRLVEEFNTEQLIPLVEDGEDEPETAPATSRSRRWARLETILATVGLVLIILLLFGRLAGTIGHVLMDLFGRH